MWFVGLLIGLVLGSMTGSGIWMLGAGLLGWGCGLIYSDFRNHPKQLEQRIDVLEKQVRQLSAQIAAQSQTRQTLPESDTAFTPTPVVVAPPSCAAVTDISPAAPAKPKLTLDSLFPRSVSAPMNLETPRDVDSGAAVRHRALPQSDWFSRLLKDNLLAKIGVVILFFGIASGLKLAVDAGLFPISVRLMLGALAAVSMTLFGFHRAQQPKHRLFGQALQGGGLGILYLLVYFMLARYRILDETPAFLLFTLIGVTCVLSAARQDARSLALLGISGAFLSPVMAAGGSQITLFGYFLLLNVFIISVNWFKGWRELNISGFIFTLVIGMNWAFRSYQADDFSVSETFLILFFLLYSATPVLFNLFKAPGRFSWGDGMLLYGTPLAAALLQNQLLPGEHRTLAWNACAAGAYYLLLWWAVYRRPNEETVWLEKSLLGIAIGFFTLAIPLAFNAQLTAAFWTLEGFGVLYLGVRQNRPRARLAGSALQVLAGLYFFDHSDELQRILPIFNDWAVGCLIVAVAALSSALLLRGEADKKPARFALPFLYWGLLWWFVAGFDEIDRFAPSGYKMAFFLGLCLFSLVFVEWLGAKRNWPAMRQPSALLLFAILVTAFEGHQQHGHALYGILFLLLPSALLAHYWLLHRHDRDCVPSACDLRHAIVYWLLIALAGSELVWVAARFAPGNTLWPWLAWGVSGAFGILACLRGMHRQWPFALHRELYLDTLQIPVVSLLGVWLIYGNLSHSGGGSGLPYLPILNPFDLIQLLAMYAVWKWLRAIHSKMSPVLYGVAFLWISSDAARLAHHWGGVPFAKRALLDSFMLQAGLSVLWTAIAMGLMIHASRSKQRALWFYGFTLLAIVGIKLMLIDLSNKGTALWSLSLIGIALLILATSYFSPAPPKDEAQSLA